MKKIFPVLFLFCVGVCLYKPLYAQSSLPSYLDVLTEFYKHYSFSKDRLPDGINFAKMKDGWHCQVINQITEEVKTDEIFWYAEDKKFLPLAAFEAPDEMGLEDNVTAAFEGYNSFRLYSFERSPYYGYSGWTEDMISEFSSGAYSKYSDTLIEALAELTLPMPANFCGINMGGTIYRATH